MVILLCATGCMMPSALSRHAWLGVCGDIRPALLSAVRQLHLRHHRPDLLLQSEKQVVPVMQDYVNQLAVLLLEAKGDPKSPVQAQIDQMVTEASLVCGCLAMTSPVTIRGLHSTNIEAATMTPRGPGAPRWEAITVRTGSIPCWGSSCQSDVHSKSGQLPSGEWPSAEAVCTADPFCSQS